MIHESWHPSDLPAVTMPTTRHHAHGYGYAPARVNPWEAQSAGQDEDVWPASELFARFPDLIDAAIASGTPSTAEMHDMQRINRAHARMQQQRGVLLNAVIATVSDSIMSMFDEAVSAAPFSENGALSPQNPLQRELMIELELLMDELWLTDEVAHVLQPGDGNSHAQGRDAAQPGSEPPLASQVPVPGRLTGGMCLNPTAGLPDVDAGPRESQVIWESQARALGSMPTVEVGALTPEYLLAHGANRQLTEMWQLRQLLSIRDRVSQAVTQLRKPKPVKLRPCAAAAA